PYLGLTTDRQGEITILTCPTHNQKFAPDNVSYPFQRTYGNNIHAVSARYDGSTNDPWLVGKLERVLKPSKMNFFGDSRAAYLDPNRGWYYHPEYRAAHIATFLY